MSETRFTPGPWRKFRELRIGAMNGDGVCECWSIDDEGTGEANAHLIAAAPELYDLALNVGGTDDRLLTSADLHVLRATLREWIDQARAALAKARGESPKGDHHGVAANAR